MTKNEDSTIGIAIALILGVAAIVFLVYGFASDWEMISTDNSDNFIITKEVCKNQTSKFRINCIETECPETWMDYCEMCDDAIAYVEVCDWFEVDEIEECGGSYLCKDEPECCLGYYADNKILTERWLVKRCECTEVFNIEKENNNDYAIFIENNCKKFKCGDYNVEVKE